MECVPRACVWNGYENTKVQTLGALEMSNLYTFAVPLFDRLGYVSSIYSLASLVLLTFAAYVHRVLMEALESGLHHCSQHYAQTHMKSGSARLQKLTTPFLSHLPPHRIPWGRSSLLPSQVEICHSVMTPTNWPNYFILGFACWPQLDNWTFLFTEVTTPVPVERRGVME